MRELLTEPRHSEAAALAARRIHADEPDLAAAEVLEGTAQP